MEKAMKPCDLTSPGGGGLQTESSGALLSKPCVPPGARRELSESGCGHRPCLVCRLEHEEN